jgi:rhodanese-related sulfurtransferase
MQKRSREHHHHRRSHQDRAGRNSLTSAIRKPGTQIAFLIVVALVIFLILQFSGGNKSDGLTPTITVKQAYNLYQNGAFVLDVRTQEEWDEYHVPNTTLIPLDQLPSRLSEVPHDKQIVVVCRSGNRSQKGRDILLTAGFKQVTSMSGGLTEWRANSYPIEP